MERFVRRRNVAHYRAMLAEKDLDPARREMILKLLAEAESTTDAGLTAVPPVQRRDEQ